MGKRILSFDQLHDSSVFYNMLYIQSGESIFMIYGYCWASRLTQSHIYKIEDSYIICEEEDCDFIYKIIEKFKVFPCHICNGDYALGSTAKVSMCEKCIKLLIYCRETYNLERFRKGIPDHIKCDDKLLVNNTINFVMLFKSAYFMLNFATDEEKNIVNKLIYKYNAEKIIV